MVGGCDSGRCNLDGAEHDANAHEDQERPHEPRPPQWTFGAFLHRRRAAPIS